MRSATLYFNGPLYRKTMARFWPLWGLWGIIWIFLLPLNLLNTYLAISRDLQITQTNPLAYLAHAQDLLSFLASGVFLALPFGVLAAMAVFGYLYNHRSACWFHALPLRREALFTTQYLAGLSMLLLPQLAASLLTALVEVSFLEVSHWPKVLGILLLFVLAQSGVSLFCFSFAAFCAMFTGHILALPVFYGVLNFLVAGIWYMVDLLLREFFYGYAGISNVTNVIQLLTPGIALHDAVRVTFHDSTSIRSPNTLLLYAIAGVFLFFAALYVYRRRHVETAGDVVAVAIVRPLFKYGVTLCSGLAFGMFTYAFFSWGPASSLICSVLFWSVAGYFVAEMLLKKSFRVLNAWKGAAVTVALLLLFCVCCMLDVFHVVGRVPNAAQVTSVQVNLELGYPYDNGRRLDTTFTDPAQIERILALHRAVVDSRNQKAASPDDYTSVYLYYTLSGGGELNRRYHSVPICKSDWNTPGTVSYALRQFLEDRELVELAYGFDSLLDGARLTTARLTTLEQTSPYGDTSYTSFYVDDYAQELWDAVRADFAEGTIGLRYPFYLSQEMAENTYETSLVFGATDNQTAARPGADVAAAANRQLEIYLTPHAKRTLAVLDKTGVWDAGYSLTPWEDYDTPSTVSTGAEGSVEVLP